MSREVTNDYIQLPTTGSAAIDKGVALYGHISATGARNVNGLLARRAPVLASGNNSTDSGTGPSSTSEAEYDNALDRGPSGLCLLPWPFDTVVFRAYLYLTNPTSTQVRIYLYNQPPTGIDTSLSDPYVNSNSMFGGTASTSVSADGWVTATVSNVKTTSDRMLYFMVSQDANVEYLTTYVLYAQELTTAR